MCLVFDRKDGKKAYYLRMYHPANFELIFSVELYYGFKDYIRISKNTTFATFPFANGYIGLQFLNE